MTLSFVLTLAVVLLVYEWTHYVIHSDYTPRTRAYKAIWRNHRLHHYKNEHYWFSVTTSGTSDRLLGTLPRPGDGADQPDGQGPPRPGRRRPAPTRCNAGLALYPP